jgi:hypothetical protein
MKPIIWCTGLFGIGFAVCGAIYGFVIRDSVSLVDKEIWLTYAAAYGGGFGVVVGAMIGVGFLAAQDVFAVPRKERRSQTCRPFQEEDDGSLDRIDPL